MQSQNLKTSIGTKNDDTDASKAALKKALQIELQSKRQCTYKPYECSQLCLDGYKYCARHILNDKNAPFKQCNFTFPNNGKKCHLPALRGDKKDISYCSEHALKATLIKNRQNCKFQPPPTAEVVLNSLSHYVKKPRSRTQSQQSDEGGASTSVEENDLKVTKSIDPFDIDAYNLYNNQCNEILGYCSESDSDIEPSTLNNIWHDAQEDSSDNESIDSEQEDYLKHANIYTAEEITAIARDKLIRLQSLYIEEYRHLQYLLKEKRRKYLHSLKREKETCCNIHNQIRDNPKEQRLYKKLKACQSYHKSHGVEAIFNKRLHDARAKKPHNYSKCLYTEGGVKCAERTLPLAKHCRKHILEDPNQVLFRSCGRVRADVECNTPIEAIFDDASCKLHADIPPIKSYNQTRKDSESDYDESLENNPTLPILMEPNLHLSAIKSEFTIPKMESVPSMIFEDSANDTNEEDDGLTENMKREIDNDDGGGGDVGEIEMVMEKIELKPSVKENKVNESKCDNGKLSEIENTSNDQLNESTDTASETNNDTKKDTEENI